MQLESRDAANIVSFRLSEIERIEIMAVSEYTVCNRLVAY